jgi:hypothetical protein
MATTLIDKLKDTSKEVRSRSGEFIGGTYKAGRELVELAQAEASELKDFVARRREDWERDGRELVTKALGEQRVEIDKLEVRVLSTLDDLLAKANTTLNHRFQILEKTLSRIEDRLREVEERAENRANGATNGTAAHAADTDVDAAQTAAGAETLPAGFPIENYAALTVDEVKLRVEGLPEDALRAVLDHETAHKNRKGVLQVLEAKLAKQHSAAAE